MSSSPQIQIGVRCRRCSKFRHPREFVGGPYGYCLRCLEKHMAAMKMLEGGVPYACQECGITPMEVCERSGCDDIRMEMHYRDGLYQFLCKPCGDEYARKRLDIYEKTPFALRRGIG
jgi:hypothetical protein